MTPGLPLEPIPRALADTQRLYAGAYPGYRAPPTPNITTWGTPWR